MDSATVNLIGILHERAASLCEAGNLAEASHAANAALNTAHPWLGPDLLSVDVYVKCLEVRGGILRQMGNLLEAKDDYLEGLDLLQNRPDKTAETGRLHAGLGVIFDMEGDQEEAREHWEKAIQYFEKHDPPLELDVASMANNLGFLHRQAGNLADAETYFLRALEITHQLLGREHEQTATVCSNLGALYLKTGLYEQAREMHMMALESRRTLLGEGHPDTAQSHNNLALALLHTGDRTWAKRHFEKALESFEALGNGHADDLEAVAENYCDFLRSEGEETMANVIHRRVGEILGTSTGPKALAG